MNASKHISVQTNIHINKFLNQNNHVISKSGDYLSLFLKSKCSDTQAPQPLGTTKLQSGQ